jgi:hypothetical protein
MTRRQPHLSSSTAYASPLFEKILDRVLNNDSERNAENKLAQHYPCVLSDQFLAFNLSR